MRLPTFIIDNIDQIIAEWKNAAFPSASPLEGQAKQILMAVATDIDSGANLSTSSAAVTVRTVLRAAPDFSIEQVSQALRLMRSVVQSMWKPLDEQAYSELLRFHEAIDFAAGEAVSQHVLQVERTRSLFLGMLGHDLRSPLTAINMACQYLAREDVPQERKFEAVARVSRCAGIRESMIGDVLDFSRSRLGKGMAVAKKRVDIGAACHEALAHARAEHPRADFRFDASGDLGCMADSARLRQALHNLLNSAARNGTRKEAPIFFTASGKAGAIDFRVQCEGAVMPVDTLRTMFDPIAQLAIAGANPDCNPPADLGLELFIARAILRAHGGDIGVASGDGGIVLEATLPRR